MSRMIASPYPHPYTIERLHADMLWDFRLIVLLMFILWLVLFVAIVAKR